MSKADAISIRGQVEKAVGNGAFKVKLEGRADVIHCTIAGRLRKNNIYIIVGDYVDLELSPYDLQRGRIAFRHKTRPEDYKND